MSEEIEKTLTDNLSQLIEWVKASANATGAFIKEQSPLFVQEYLSWLFWDNVITVFTLVVGFIISLCCLLKVLKDKTLFDDDVVFRSKHLIFISSGLGVIFFGIGGLVSGFDALKTAVKVKIAPRVVLVEKMQELINKK
jgi:multisubunit Na+/H+ antiporter MnhE subunit